MKKFSKKLHKLFFRNNKGMTFMISLFFIAALCFRIMASDIGTMIGEQTGTIVGKGIGSLRGVTKGRADGTAAGKDAGLSAKDTIANVRTDIAEIGQLQVLTAGVKITDYHKLGKAYAALYVVKGSAVFTVDLKQATVDDYDDRGSSMVISIPKPQVEVYIDVNETEKLAEYQKHKFAGSAEDGAKAYLNSMVQSEEEIKESINNYDNFLEQAQTAARNQIETLVDTVRGEKISLTINFI